MLLKVFSIYDKCAEAFNQPFFMLTRAEAMRAFTNEVCTDNSMINKHPGDYHLYEIGTFDNATGLVTCDQVEDLGNGFAFKKMENVVSIQEAGK